MNPDWKDYERQILHLIRAEYLDCDAYHNTTVLGKKSKSHRQIDVLVLKKKGKKIMLGLGECRNIKRKINVTTIDGIVGKMKDIGAKFAIVITTIGHTASAKKFADNSNIEIKIVPYEFLKDFGFIDTNLLDHDFHMEEVEYPAKYCKECDTTNLFEIKAVRGFSEHDWVMCPKCKTKQFETRTEGGYRVIKRFLGNNVNAKEKEKVIVDNLLWTRDSWDRVNPAKPQYVNDIKIKKGKNCEICSKLFNNSLPHSQPHNYKKRKICIECIMSSRTLLIDYGKI